MFVLVAHLFLVHLCLLLLSPVRAQNEIISPGCQAGFRYLNSKETVNVYSCKGPCIVKCCPEKQIFLANESGTFCVESHHLSRTYGVIDPDNYSKSKIDIYNKDFKDKAIKTNKKLSDFTFIFSEKFLEPDCTKHFSEVFAEENHAFYLSEAATAGVWTANDLDPWNDFSTEQFCVEHLVTLRNGTLESRTPRVDFVAFTEPAENESSARAQYGMYGMLVSCFFLAMTLLVYGVLPILRRLPGKIAMAFVATLLATYLCRVMQIVANNLAALDQTACSVVSILLIYMLLSSFAWMNVLSYDLWCIVRGSRMIRHNQHWEAKMKFCRYCLFAWGVPLIPVLFIIIVEHLDLTHLPNFVKPRIIYDLKNCFLEDDERRLYLNIPIGIAMLTNIILFVRIALKIFYTMGRVKHMPGESKRSGPEQNRFYLIVKVSCLMGITSVFEVISSEVSPDSPLWYVFDIYNTLTGVIVFVIYVCKRTVLGELCKRFRILNDLAEKCGIRSYFDTTTTRGMSNNETELSEVGNRNRYTVRSTN